MDERFNRSLKYEHLYRRAIDTSADLAIEVGSLVDLYNNIRPHEALGFSRPADRCMVA